MLSFSSLFSNLFFFKSRQAQSEKVFFIESESEKTVKNKFSELSLAQKSFLQNYCKNKLLSEENTFKCLKKNLKTKPSLGLIKILRYLVKNGSKQNLIFRNDGDRNLTRAMAYYIHKDYKINYEAYEIIDLATAVKTYLRDYMFGFFDKDLFCKIFDCLKKSTKNTKAFIAPDPNSPEYDAKTLLLLSKYLIFSLSKEERECIIEFQNLINKIDANYDKTNMSYTSSVNILSLNMLPEESFQDLYMIPNIVYYFNYFFKLDMDELDNLVHVFY